MHSRPAPAAQGALAQNAALSRAVPITASAYVVRPGDTLWKIAKSLQPAGDVRPLVQRLAAARPDMPLRAGEWLILPSR